MERIRNGAAAAFLAISGLAAGFLAAQDTSQSQPPVVLKATARLVLVSVVAQDHQNQPVADLKKENFQLRVNGKPQELRVFSMDAGGSVSQPNDKPLPALPANLYTNRLALRPNAPSAVTVILLDTRNTRAADQIYAKAQIIKYLRTLRPTDHVGLYTFGASLRVLHDYTTDSAELLNRLTAAKGKEIPDVSGLDPQSSLRSDALEMDGWIRGAGGASAAERNFYTTDRVLATLRTFEFIAEHLAQVPGRKNLVWVSGGFPLDVGYDSIADWHNPAVDQRTFTDEVNRTMRAMNEANIAVYPVDARGLMVDSRFDASHSTFSLRPSLAPPVGLKEQQTMQEVAGRTGGIAYYNTNDLTTAIQNAVDDSRVTYTLGFYPSDGRFDGKFHKIDLQLNGRSGVRLRYRKGYFDLAEQPEDDKMRNAELQNAVWSPMDAGALGLTAEVLQHKPDAASIDVKVRIDHSGITLQPQQDRWKGRVDVLFVQRDDQGKQYDGRNDTINLDLGVEKHDKLATEDLTYHQVLLRAPRAKILRIVVRDAASGATGSVTVPLSR